MDMGVLKPFEASRSITVGASTGLSAGRSVEGQMAGAAQAAPTTRPVATQTPDAVEQVSEIDSRELQSVVSDIQNFVQSVRRDINFQLDDTSGRVVVNVTEAISGNIIRQIPSEEALRLAENLSEIRSLLFEAEA